MTAANGALAPPASKAAALRRIAAVLGAAARERSGRGPTDGVTRVPVSLAELTAPWLTSILCGGVAGARVSSVRAVDASAGTTTRFSLELSYNAEGAAAGLPRRLFVKCTPGLSQRLMLGLGGFLAGEPAFYTYVRPGLSIEAPAGYYGAVEPRSWRSIVVIEDVVATRGATFWRPGTATSRGQIEALLGEVAVWHGLLWESDQLGRWGWLRTPAEFMALVDTLISLANRLPAGARRARAVVPPSLQGRQADLFTGLRRSMEMASRGPRTYLHGDLHVANTYATADGRMGIGDWQIGLRGSWAHDYAYLVTSALAVEDRRAWEGELLEHYLERLREAGGPRIPSAAAWEAYRGATLYPYFAWVYTIGRSRLQPRFQPDDVCLTLIGRIAAAIDDLGSLRAVGL